MKLLKKIFILSFALLLLLSVLPLTASADYLSLVERIGEEDEARLYSEIALLVHVDENTGDITTLIEKNATEQTAPASLLKIMTAIVALENSPDLQRKVQVSAAAIHLLDGTNAAIAGLKPGETLTIEQLLYCLLVRSACDAATVLAEAVCGSQEVFVQRMNAKAAELGCTNTNFVNAIGLDAEGQYTTARDMLTLTLYAMQNPTFAHITAQTSYTLEATNLSARRRMNTTNFVLVKSYKLYYHADAAGIKTGTTTEAGRCVITKASRNGYTYYAVLMRAPSVDVNKDGVQDNTAFVDTKRLYHWVFEHIRLVSVAEPTQIVAEVPLSLSGSVDFVRLVPAGEQFALVPSGVDKGSVLLQPIAESIPVALDAPIVKGTPYGKARVMYAGKEIAQVDLVAETDIDRNAFLYAASVAREMLKSPAMRLIGALLLLMLIAYIAFSVWLNLRKKNRRKLRVVDYRDMPKGGRNRRK